MERKKLTKPFVERRVNRREERDHVALEMPLYQALIALDMPHFSTDHLHDLIAGAAIVSSVRKDLTDSIIYICSAITKRDLTGDELSIFKENIKKMIEVIRGMSNAEISRALVNTSYVRA